MLISAAITERSVADSSCNISFYIAKRDEKQKDREESIPRQRVVLPSRSVKRFYRSAE